MTEVRPEVRVLRGRARAALSMGADPGAVMFGLVRDARLSLVSDVEVRGIADDLRAEGLLPELEADDG